MTSEEKINEATKECGRIFDKYKLSPYEAARVINMLTHAREEVELDILKELIKEIKEDAAK